MSEDQEPIYAWCFSHGRPHQFPSGSDPWCTANWVPLRGRTPSEALRNKRMEYGEASFIDELPGDVQLEVIEVGEKRREMGKK